VPAAAATPHGHEAELGDRRSVFRASQRAGASSGDRPRQRSILAGRCGADSLTLAASAGAHLSRSRMPPATRLAADFGHPNPVSCPPGRPRQFVAGSVAFLRVLCAPATPRLSLNPPQAFAPEPNVALEHRIVAAAAIRR